MHVAILGCGQLARMMALAGIPMGMTFTFLSENGEDTAPVDGLGAVVAADACLTAEELFAAAGKPDVVTVEREQCALQPLQKLAEHCPVHPNTDAIYQCQNRQREKQLLINCNVSHTPFVSVASASDLEVAVEKLGFPMVVKHTEQGYDGKAQWRLYNTGDVENFVTNAQFKLQSDEAAPYVAEPFMNFDREVSFVAVRSRSGEVRVYPAAENVHDNSVLLHSLAPAPGLPQALVDQGQASIRRIMEHLDYVGVMAMECFVTSDGLWVNELAPRVHNSGHWTMHCGVASQFQNHMRAIAGWPLGSTELSGAAGMLNLLGVELNQIEQLDDNVALDWYNKSVRPGRKLGHLVLKDESSASAQTRLLTLKDKVYRK
ncbi:5-(carboxyamino)imidazole ribonucleotide synthase [Gilvimarinus sp. SDUM040013]|uniref:N5-carboxyaminoimidazole ribonucleotide synthase n=1 Tax=Gilvimarinus gilvus TaxID=3058038 RepID=A0ABU4RWP1_9GAMM|nr:5-(carboxyamino)imidazole ribonucleotide synthase [Gilvimarinus sp. SDUM040013]MDO3385661.1 5-(carboxyamino)imidazole ribonucleotide synthase [Gilvimarinus sp. SDUM040013]MDX6849299.1 5-(carboxyamino)imidazole ribonucleotide synthase [Gilvimarinus sp. SDUM040013]